jgi:hypothetical protein
MFCRNEVSLADEWCAFASTARYPAFERSFGIRVPLRD